MPLNTFELRQVYLCVYIERWEYQRFILCPVAMMNMIMKPNENISDDVILICITLSMRYYCVFAIVSCSLLTTIVSVMSMTQQIGNIYFLAIINMIFMWSKKGNFPFTNGGTPLGRLKRYTRSDFCFPSNVFQLLFIPQRRPTSFEELSTSIWSTGCCQYILPLWRGLLDNCKL